MKRVFLIVLDSCGCGEMPDAAKFGDKDCNTIKRISSSPFFSCLNTRKMGMGNIPGLDFLGIENNPSALVGRLAERSMGKDTTTGHWEIAGLISPEPMPVYPDGFPDEIIEALKKTTGRGVLCNRPYSGTEVIKDYGEEHIKTGKLIVYTSADSVFQIAAHTDVVPLETLYDYCRKARALLKGRHAVGRVIARPFEGEYPYKRTSDRHDFSLLPPEDTVLDALKNMGRTVYAIGKIYDIFAGKGITEHVFTHSNDEGMKKALDALDKSFEGLCFINLVDFDMLYGHRQDVDGYAKAFSVFDKWLPSFTSRMKDEDILMITADHGCDPGDNSTDHTREYVPLIVYGKNVKPGCIGTGNTYADIAASISEYFDADYISEGKSFL